MVKKTEKKLKLLNYYELVLKLQGRETAEDDLANVLENDNKESKLDYKIGVAKDIFENSTSREYLISLQRYKKAVEN